jgi:hypothetical protein
MFGSVSVQAEEDKIEKYTKKVMSLMDQIEKAGSKCINKSNGSDFEMQECIGVAVEHLKKTLSEVEKSVFKAAPNPELNKLLQADRKSFDKVLEKVADIAYDNGGGGTLSGVIRASTYASFLKDRIKFMLDVLGTTANR